MAIFHNFFKGIMPKHLNGGDYIDKRILTSHLAWNYPPRYTSSLLWWAVDVYGNLAQILHL